jgi:MFS family permease
MAAASARANNRTIGLDGWAFVVLAAAQVTLIAAITAITVALPAIGRDLNLDQSGLVLVSSGYGVSFGGLLLLGGGLADRFGGRRVFAAGMTGFCLGSAAAAVAPWAWFLVTARLAEGAAAALAAPAALALLGTVFPDPRRHGRALATWGVLSSAGAIAGLVLSGVLPWRWVLAALALIAAIAVAVTPTVLPASPASARGRLDWPGALLVTAGLALLIYGLQRSVWVAGAGLAVLVMFGLAERRSGAPLVPPPLLRRRALPLAAVLVCAGSMATAFFLLSLYLQQSRGLSGPHTSALFLLTVPAAVGAGPLAARLIGRFGIRPVLVAGLLTAAGGLLLVSFVGAPYAGLLIFPFGTGLSFAASVSAVMQDAGDRQSGLAGALVNAAMETGPPLGLAVLTRVAASFGDPFALRSAAVLLLIVALSTTQSPCQPPSGGTRHDPSIHRQGSPRYRRRIRHWPGSRPRLRP